MDETLLYNDVRFTRTGGSQQTGEDTTSQTNYGKRSLSKSGLLNNTDVSVDVICDYFAARYGDVDHSRVKFVGITPDCDLINLTTHCLNREISDRITIRLDQSGIDNDFYIEGINHDVVFIGPNAWMLQTKWNLSDATRWLYTPTARTQTLLPNASGDETNINSKTEATNWESVIATTTATYVANTDNETTFDRDFYNLAAAEYPSGVISKITVRGDFLADPNAKTVQGAVKLCVKSGATVDESGEHVVSIATYETINEDWATDPNTGAAWTWAAIDALQVGPSIKRATPSGGSTNWTRCKYILVTIYYTPEW